MYMKIGTLVALCFVLFANEGAAAPRGGTGLREVLQQSSGVRYVTLSKLLHHKKWRPVTLLFLRSFDILSLQQRKEFFQSVQGGKSPKQVRQFLQNVRKKAKAAASLRPLKNGKKKQQYRGRRISMKFKQVDILKVLQLFSQISGMNIIASRKVKGKISIKLRNVPWDQAFDIILGAMKLVKKRQGNVIHVHTSAELRKAKRQLRK